MCDVLYELPLLPGDLFFYVGIAAVLIGATVLGLNGKAEAIVQKYNLRMRPPSMSPRLFFILWGGVVCLIGSGFVLANAAPHFITKAAYDAGEYTTVEGVVKVLNEQPWDGHAPGDKIAIGGEELVIDAYQIAPGYKTTLAKGGVHKDGARLKMKVVDGHIVHICAPK